MANEQSIFPPLKQSQLFQHLRKRVGIPKYIKLLITINDYLSAPPKTKTNPKSPYDTLVTALINCYYSEEEKQSKNDDDQTIFGAFRITNLRSLFLSDHLEQHLQRAHVGGSYYDSSKLEDGSTSSFSGMTTEDRQVLNSQYILKNSPLHGGKIGQGKEATDNFNNDKRIQVAEDKIHDIEMLLVRNRKLQFKLHHIIDSCLERRRINNGDTSIDFKFVVQASSKKIDSAFPAEMAYYNAFKQASAGKSTGEMPKKKPYVEFCGIELAALVDLYGYEKRIAPNKIVKIVAREKKVAMGIRESLIQSPYKTAKHLLPMLKKRYETLKDKKQIAVDEFMKVMEECLPGSIARNSGTIKQNEYTSFSSVNIMNEITHPASGREAPKTCFLSKSGDVSTQLNYENGLLMQFESVRWHKEAFDLLQGSRRTPEREKVMRFVELAKIFFDLNIQQDGCARVHEGDFSGFMYGNESLYIAIRLYHILLVRLYSTFLQADVDAKEWAFRKHCDDVGKARLEAINPLAYIPEATKKAVGWNKLALPPSEGTTEEKMARFLEILKKRDMRTTANPYPAEDFEKDVIWAVGVPGNQFFTMPRILGRIRDTVVEIDDSCFDLFDRYCEQVRNGVQEAEKKYEEEVSEKCEGWVLKLQCSYSDSFVDDEWCSVGECGEVGRVKAMIVRMGTALREKRPSGSPSGGKPTKKRRTNRSGRS